MSDTITTQDQAETLQVAATYTPERAATVLGIVGGIREVLNHLETLLPEPVSPEPPQPSGPAWLPSMRGTTTLLGDVTDWAECDTRDHRRVGYGAAD